jgi:hypothetical protein
MQTKKMRREGKRKLAHQQRQIEAKRQKRFQATVHMVEPPKE